MTMGLALEAARDYLRQTCELEKSQCGIQYEGTPPANAVSIYVTVDDGGMDTAGDTSHYLKEIVKLEIGVWRQPHGMIRDRWSQWLVPESVYGTYLVTLEQLERKVIAALHRRYEFLKFINDHAQLPQAGRGYSFNMPLVYRGRSKLETITVENGTDHGIGWIGRRLNFRGLDRTQKIGACLG